MKKKILLSLILLGLSFPAHAQEPKRVDVTQFGSGRLFKTERHPSVGFVALLSPSQGWDAQSTEVAEKLAKDGYMVLGLDVKTYKEDRRKANDECLYPSGIIEDISQDLQKAPDGEAYHRPIVIGLGDSGFLASVVMLQNLPGTYKAALAPSFCPKLDFAKPFCVGARLTVKDKKYKLANANAIKTDEGFFAARDPYCSASLNSWPMTAALGTQAFIDTNLAKVKKQTQPAALHSLEDLPLTYLPSDRNDWLVILVSGDGGWRDIDRQLAENLQKNGYAVIGVDSLRYFWNEKTPQDTAAMLDRIVVTAGQDWHKKNVALVGYSFGADILPFTLAKMQTNKQVRFMGLLGFARYALFEITAGGYIGIGDKRYDNIEAMKQVPHKVTTLCVFGKADAEDDDDDTDTLCPKLHQSWVEPLGLPGGHHFDGDYAALTRHLITRMEKIDTATAKKK